MREKYKKGSHSIFDLHYHYVWITEYRHNILIDKKGALKAKDLIRQTDKAWRSIILSAHMSKDHVHVVYLPKIGPIKIA